MYLPTYIPCLTTTYQIIDISRITNSMNKESDPINCLTLSFYKNSHKHIPFPYKLLSWPYTMYVCMLAMQSRRKVEASKMYKHIKIVCYAFTPFFRLCTAYHNPLSCMIKLWNENSSYSGYKYVVTYMHYTPAHLIFLFASRASFLLIFILLASFP